MASSTSGEEWIYHEKQVSSLCGQHCLNNLLQDCLFSAPDLADIAQDLNAKERKYMLEAGDNTPDALRFLAEDSGNVDETGNFSIQVLSEAIKRSHGLYLVSADSESVRGKLSTTGYHREGGFLCNKQSHWFAIRSIGGTYWNLNSTLGFPDRISTFHLEVALDQLRSDGYSVFVVRGGELPMARENPGQGARDSWYRVEELMAVARGTTSKPATAATDVWLNSGPGQRLDGGGGSGWGQRPWDGLTEDEQLALALSTSVGERRGEGGEQMSEEDDIMRAIAMSLADKDGDGQGGGSGGGAPKKVGYEPKPVPDEPPPGSGVVRVQVQIRVEGGVG
ncbi:unnamed protein product [Choristocarpus tenellus]